MQFQLEIKQLLVLILGRGQGGEILAFLHS